MATVESKPAATTTGANGIPVENPATGEVITHVPAMSDAEVKEFVASARDDLLDLRVGHRRDVGDHLAGRGVLDGNAVRAGGRRGGLGLDGRHGLSFARSQPASLPDGLRPAR